MSELRQLLALWREAKSRDEEVCLATVVQVEGSSYRKPGARMLLRSGGRRAGTVSGGCLEAEIQKKAWWLTASGASVQRYSSFFDEDSEIPYGLGCGGTVHVLLQRGSRADAVMAALEMGSISRRALAIVTSMATNPGIQAIVAEDGEVLEDFAASDVVLELAKRALRERHSFHAEDFFVEYAAPPLALFVCGAGDDTVPLVEFAHRLGWEVTVADGRSHLATAERFPMASRVVVTASFADLPVAERDAAVILTHSYEQDRAALRALLRREPMYLGVLGPRARTERLIAGIASGMGLTPDACVARLHSPVGLDIGAQTPAGIALSIVAEIHAALARPHRRSSVRQMVYA